MILRGRGEYGLASPALVEFIVAPERGPHVVPPDTNFQFSRTASGATQHRREMWLSTAGRCARNGFPNIDDVRDVTDHWHGRIVPEDMLAGVAVIQCPPRM